MEALPSSTQELAARLRLMEHDCDGCGSKTAPVKPIRSPRIPLFLRFLCDGCLDGDVLPRLLGEAMHPSAS